MEKQDLFSNENNKILSIYHFDDINFWKKTETHNYYGIFIIEPIENEGLINFEQKNTIIKSKSLLCYFPLQKLEFKNNFKGVLLLFHPNFFCIDIQASNFGCQGVLFQNIFGGSICKLTTEYYQNLVAKFKEIEYEIQENQIGKHENIINIIRMILIISLRAFKTNGNNLITNNTLNKFKIILDNNVLKEHRPKF